MEKEASNWRGKRRALLSEATDALQLIIPYLCGAAGGKCQKGSFETAHPISLHSVTENSKKKTAPLLHKH